MAQDNTSERNENFEIKVGFDNLEEPTDNIYIPLTKKGVFGFRVEDAYTNTSKAGNERMVLKLVVTEDPQPEVMGSTVGHTITTGLNVPKSKEDPVRYYWRALFLSLGFDPDKPGARFSRQMLVNKSGYVYFAPKARNGYDDVKYLTASGYEKQKSTVFAQDAASQAPNTPTANPYGSEDAPGDQAAILLERLKSKGKTPPPPPAEDDVPF